MDERSAVQETMRRENRRVAAMSWGSGEDLPPPPKPARYPMQGILLLFNISDLTTFLI